MFLHTDTPALTGDIETSLMAARATTNIGDAAQSLVAAPRPTFEGKLFTVFTCFPLIAPAKSHSPSAAHSVESPLNCEDYPAAHVSPRKLQRSCAYCLFTQNRLIKVRIIDERPLGPPMKRSCFVELTTIKRPPTSVIIKTQQLLHRVQATGCALSGK